MSSKKKNIQQPKTAAEKNAGPKSVSSKKKATFIQRDLWIKAFLLGLFAFLLYVNTFSNDFVLDDTSSVSLNNFVKSGFKGIPKILSTEYRAGFWGVNGNLYRPLPLVIFAAIWQYFPDNVLPFHVVNCLAFALTAGLLFLLLVRLLRPSGYLIPLLITLLFIIHPIHTEVVANIKSLDELLSLFFSLLCIYLILNYLDNKKTIHLVLLFISYFLAMASKEGAITLVVIFPLVMYFFTKAERRDYVATAAAFGVAAVSYLLIRTYVLSHQTGHPYTLEVVDNSILAAKDFGEKTASCFVNLGKYLLMSVYPHPLAIDYTYNQIPIVGWSNIYAILSLLAFLAMGVLILLRFKKKEAWIFGLMFFLITISLYSNLFYVIGVNFAERLLYIPSLGICIAFVTLLDKFLSGKEENQPLFARYKFVIAIVALLSVVGTAKTFARNKEWKSLLTLCEADIDVAPQSAHLNFWYGKELIIDIDDRQVPEKDRAGTYEKAINYFTKAIEIYPPFGDAYAYRGKLYVRQNRVDLAESDYHNAAIRRVPMWDVYRDLGILLQQRNDFDSAIYFYKKALNLDNKQAIVYQNMAFSFQRKKQYEDAINCLMQALAIDNTQAGVYEDMAVNHHYLKHYDEAISYYQLALKHLAPNEGGLQREIYSNISQAYRAKGDLENAKKYEVH